MSTTDLISNMRQQIYSRSVRERSISNVLARLREIALSGYPWVYVAGWAITIYLMTNSIEVGRLSASVSTYAVRPLLWISLALMAVIGWREGVLEKPAMSSLVPISGALAGSFHVAPLMIAGLIYGFGHSPYSHQPLALLGNLVHVGAMLVAIEMSRACVVGSLGARRPYLALALATILFAFLELPTSWPSSFEDAGTGFMFVGETLLPGLSESLLASFLAFTGGPIASLVYRGFVHGFEWISPILPHMQWTVAAFLGTVVPALGLVLLRGVLVSDTDEDESETEQAGGISTSWVVVSITAVAMLWFNAGLFGVRPTIVSGLSMKPALELGDLVVTREVDPEMIEVGDIIQFRRGGDYILHRVVEVEATKNEVFFVTRGDANNVNDDPVLEAAIVGKVILVIPKLGWLGIVPRLLIQRIGALL